MNRKERIKAGLETDDVFAYGYPYTRKGIDHSATGLGLVGGEKKGEYIYHTPQGKDVIVVFNGMGFSPINKGNHWKQYMNI